MESASDTQNSPSQGKRILMVDDDRLNLRILKKILSTESYETAEACSGEEALTLYSTFNPDLVLLDVMMPGINGFETCRELKRRHGASCAPIIFITAKNESDDVVEGLSAGGVDYLPKPFRAREAIARIRSHIQLRHLLEQQKSLVEQLSNANASKNRFLGMAAHDLRNPLASIRGLAEFLRDGVVGNLNDEQKDLVITIHEASQSMLELVNDLLDIATIESGELKMQRESRDLVALINKSVFLANIQAAKKGTRITFDSTVRQAMCLVDQPKIRQVVDNLLSNASKYSPPGSAIRANLSEDSGYWRFTVRDQGPGIPDGERDKLFKDFGRLSVRPTGGEKSTGLGLAICRKIVEAHDGAIDAFNQHDGGCIFAITLPL